MNMRMTDDDVYEMVNEVIDLLKVRMEGCEVHEAIGNMQVLIGCIFEQMSKNIGPHRALMKLGEVLQQAANQNPGHGVHVDMVRVPSPDAPKN